MAGADFTDFETHRAHLKGLAYRMLGSVAEAEDAVQDAYLRWHETDRDVVDNPRAYLSRIVTRLCLDRLRVARQRRETYIGPWLPEPIVVDNDLVAMSAEDVAQDVSVALLLALERLSPLERAAFILRDVFDVGFDEIAAALGRSEAACRQLASRTRSHVQAEKPRCVVTPEESAQIAQAFFSASRSGDAAALRDLLAETAVLHSDGGGRKPAALKLIFGADKVSRFFAKLTAKKKIREPLWLKALSINGLPGFLTVEWDGTLQTTAIEVEKGSVSAIYVVRNPDKLKHMEPLVPESFRA